MPLLKRSAFAAIAHTRQLVSEAKPVLRQPRDPALADKFNLARLNGGKNPFDVSSNRLLKASSRKPARYPIKLAGKPKPSAKDVYSLKYLLGGEPASADDKNPFKVASSKLM